VLGILEGLPEPDLRRLGAAQRLDVPRPGVSPDAGRRALLVPGVFAGEPDVIPRRAAGAEAHWQVPERMSAEQVLAG
jgi:hypothetical protein